MERNSEFIRTGNEGNRIKAIDCKMMSIMLTDLARHKTVLKVEDEDYILVRRAFNIKSQQKKNKRDLN